MIQQPKLPYVRFTSEVKEVKDADGHIHRSMDYTVHVTPAGGKDEFVKNADEWLGTLKEKGMTRGPFDAAANEYGRWYETFSKMLAQFKAGEEMTTSGTPLRTIMAFMKTEVAQCEAARIYSLEDLASANEEALRHIGIGARALKDKATQLIASQGDNRLAEENAALHVRLEALEERLKQMLDAGFKEPAKRGRPAKVAEE